MKRVRTKSSDIATTRETPKKSKAVTNGKRSPSPKDGSNSSSSPQAGKLTVITNGAHHDPAKFTLKLMSHGRVNGPVDDPDDGQEMLRFSVRDVPNPPAKLRKKYTGLSPRLRTEIFSEKASKLKYDTIVTELEKMITSMETAMRYDAAHQDEIDEETATVLIVSIQCEEGKHRSVAFVEELAQSETTKRKNWGVQVEHRDLGIAEAGDADADDSDEVVSPTSERASVKVKRKKDKAMKRARDTRLQVEVAGSDAEHGFF